MEKDQIIIFEDRSLISVSGLDARDFLQNILSNDVDKVSSSRTIFSAIFTPQGKYLYEFFVIKKDDGYFLDCESVFSKEIIDFLSKYKLRSKVEIKNLSSKYVVGVIHEEKFKEIQNIEKKNTETVIYRESTIFLDPRSKKLGGRILSSLEKLHLTIKKLNLKIVSHENYFKKAYYCGIPIKGIENLKDQLFGLEANFEQLLAIDFKKGCFIGQENTARMKLKNKLRRRLLPIIASKELKIGDELKYENKKIGKVLINKPFPFALVNLFNPDFSVFKDKEIMIENTKVKLINL